VREELKETGSVGHFLSMWILLLTWACGDTYRTAVSTERGTLGQACLSGRAGEVEVTWIASNCSGCWDYYEDLSCSAEVTDGVLEIVGSGMHVRETSAGACPAVCVVDSTTCSVALPVGTIAVHFGEETTEAEITSGAVLGVGGQPDPCLPD
jgi:hypothetical protein